MPAGAIEVSAEEQVLPGIEHGDLGSALNRLPPELRAVLQAAALDGLTTRKTAKLVAAWLLPSLALALASLALATVVRPLVASGAATFAWIAVAMTAAYHPHDLLIVFRGGGHVAFVFVILVSALVLARRREVLDTGRSG